MAIRTLIIDDEKPARDVIRHYLASFPQVEVIGECQDGFMGLKAIQETRPDLVFLDVQMPRLTGLELLELLDAPPLIIFSTAYDQYAIKAFEMNAADYLLKPYSLERFTQAVNKAIQQFSQGMVPSTETRKIVSAAGDSPELLQRIAVKVRHKVHVIPVDDVIFLEAEGDYVMIHTRDNRFLKEKTMKYFENHLDPERFIRIHRSYIIHASFIDRIEYYDKESYSVIMKTGASLRASSTGYKLLRQKLNM